MLFSIIIPMYNTQDTLDRCFSSVSAQTCLGYEVLIVDDGSDDGSLARAKELTSGDDRFRVLSIDHAGTGAARNCGIRHAAGDYLLFLDADDYWVDDRFLEKLADCAEQKPADVYMFHRQKVGADGKPLKRYTKPEFRQVECVLPLGEVYEDLVRDGQAVGTSTNKCVRKSLVEEKSVFFPEDIVGEDIDWALQLFCHVRTICLLNLTVYAYTQRREKTRSRSEEAPDDLVSIIDSWNTRLKEGGLPHEQAVAGQLAYQFGISMGHYDRLSPEKKELLRKNRSLLKSGLDRKTLLIRRFYRVFGFTLTAAAVSRYLRMRRV